MMFIENVKKWNKQQGRCVSIINRNDYKSAQPDNFLLVIFIATSNLIQEIKGELRFCTIYVYHNNLVCRLYVSTKEQTFITILIMVYYIIYGKTK